MLTNKNEKLIITQTPCVLMFFITCWVLYCCIFTSLYFCIPFITIIVFTANYFKDNYKVWLLYLLFICFLIGIFAIETKFSLFNFLYITIESATNGRESIINYINSIYSDKNISSFINLIIFNERDELINPIYYNMVNLSIVYLITVAGFQIQFIKMIFNLIFKWNKKINYFASNLFILFYSYFLMFSYSSMRVLITGLLWPIKFKNVYSKTAASGLIIFIFNPHCFCSFSFILSYLGTFGVLYISSLNINNEIIKKFSMSFIAILFTLPGVATLNGKISFLSLITSFIFSYLFSFVYVYFLIFAWIGPMWQIHLWIINSLNILVNFFEMFNVLIPIGNFNDFFKIIYFMFLFLFLYVIKQKYFVV